MRRVRVRVNGEWYDVQVGDVYQSPVEVEVDGETYLVELEAATSQGRARTGSSRATARPRQEQPGLRGIQQGDDKVVRSPLPGRVVSVSVVKDQALQPGDEICVLESMKMEQSVRMAHTGVAKNIKIKKDQSVGAGDPLLELQ